MRSAAVKLDGMTAGANSTADTAAVWRDFGRRLRSFIAMRVSSAADAEDILQSVYLRIHQKLPSLRSDTRLEAWLYRITRNTIVDFYRSRGVATLTEKTRSTEQSDSVETDIATSGRDEIGRCLVPMLDRLAPADREIILLTDVGEATMTEAATQLGLSVPGAKSRAQRARARLRKMFIDCCRVDFDATGRAIDLTPRRACCKSDDES